MAADWRESGIVFFTVPGDPDIHFARRFADGRFWAANRYRGWRVAGLGLKRLKPILLRGTEHRRIQIIDPPQAVIPAA